MGREIESCRGICGLIIKEKKLKKTTIFSYFWKGALFCFENFVDKTIEGEADKRSFFQLLLLTSTFFVVSPVCIAGSRKTFNRCRKHLKTFSRRKFFFSSPIVPTLSFGLRKPLGLHQLPYILRRYDRRIKI
jgi:hypothetical protein